jgi:hypothetical protein
MCEKENGKGCCFASADLTARQLNALVKKVGGPEVVKQILADRVQVVIKTIELPQVMVTCSAFSGNKCNICGSMIADGDDMCAQGHQLGSKYPQYQ